MLYLFASMSEIFQYSQLLKYFRMFHVFQIKWGVGLESGLVVRAVQHHAFNCDQYRERCKKHHGGKKWECLFLKSVIQINVCPET